MTGPIFSFSTTFRPAALAMSGMIMDVLCKEWHFSECDKTGTYCSAALRAHAHQNFLRISARTPKVGLSEPSTI